MTLYIDLLLTSALNYYLTSFDWPIASGFSLETNWLQQDVYCQVKFMQTNCWFFRRGWFPDVRGGVGAHTLCGGRTEGEWQYFMESFMHTYGINQSIATQCNIDTIVLEKKMRYVCSLRLKHIYRCMTCAECQQNFGSLTLLCCFSSLQVCLAENTPSPPLLKALQEVLPVVFALLCFTKHNVSHLR